MGPAKKKAVLKHHSEQPFFNIVVGLAPPDHHRCRTLPGQVNQLELTHFRASPEFLCYPVLAEVAMAGRIQKLCFCKAPRSHSMFRILWQ